MCLFLSKHPQFPSNLKFELNSLHFHKQKYKLLNMCWVSKRNLHVLCKQHVESTLPDLKRLTTVHCGNIFLEIWASKNVLFVWSNYLAECSRQKDWSWGWKMTVFLKTTPPGDHTRQTTDIPRFKSFTCTMLANMCWFSKGHTWNGKWYMYKVWFLFFLFHLG